MIGRWFYRLAVRYAAWALGRRAATVDQISHAIDRSFPHRDAEWRAKMLDDIRQRNRDRTMREIDA